MVLDGLLVFSVQVVLAAPQGHRRVDVVALAPGEEVVVGRRPKDVPAVFIQAVPGGQVQLREHFLDVVRHREDGQGLGLVPKVGEILPQGVGVRNIVHGGHLQAVIRVQSHGVAVELGHLVPESVVEGGGPHVLEGDLKGVEIVEGRHVGGAARQLQPVDRVFDLLQLLNGGAALDMLQVRQLRQLAEDPVGDEGGGIAREVRRGRRLDGVRRRGGGIGLALSLALGAAGIQQTPHADQLRPQPLLGQQVANGNFHRPVPGQGADVHASTAQLLRRQMKSNAVGHIKFAHASEAGDDGGPVSLRHRLAPFDEESGGGGIALRQLASQSGAKSEDPRPQARARGQGLADQGVGVGLQPLGGIDVLPLLGQVERRVPAAAAEESPLGGQIIGAQGDEVVLHPSGVHLHHQAEMQQA